MIMFLKKKVITFFKKKNYAKFMDRRQLHVINGLG